MMSRPGIIVGLLIAATLHWMVLLPIGARTRPIKAATVASIAVRELPEATPDRPEATPTERTPSPPPTPPPTPPPAPAPEPAPAPAPAPKPEPRSEPPASATTNLARVATPQQASLEGKGDFAGTPDATQRPSLRIDWGNPKQAHDVVTAAGMRLVMLAAAGGIAGEAVPTVDGWRRIEVTSADLSSYSNRVRIVDTTPAFIQAASLCTGGERLAVLLPLALEHTLRTQQIRAAAKAGVESSRIRSFYGRFRIDGGRVAFDISGFERRSS